jgi:hypothetical protein
MLNRPAIDPTNNKYKTNNNKKDSLRSASVTSRSASRKKALAARE